MPIDRNYLNRRATALKNERSTFEPLYKDVDQYILPGSTEFNTSENNQGQRKNQKIINDTATDAAGTLSSGFMGGLTSPAKVWFQVRTNSPAKNKLKAARIWLDTVTKNMADVFLRSNIYQVLPQAYLDLGGHATTAFAVLEDDEAVIRAYHFPVGSYWLGTSHRGVVDTFYREFPMTARQIVQRFGLKNCTEAVKSASERNEDAWFDVAHFVEPNPDHDDKKAGSEFKAFRSIYWELASSEGTLSEKGFDQFPIIAPRWSVRGSGIYGNQCPGFQCIGDVKMLQVGERRGWEALDKMVKPPLQAPSSLKNRPIEGIPNGVTYVDVTQGQQGVKPLYEVNVPLERLDARLARVEYRIRRAFHADLFLMISGMDQQAQPVTAAEINARREEKMLMLGPVLERLNDEGFDPLIKITFSIMLNRSMPLWGTERESEALIPPPPQEIQGAAGLVIEYVSVLAQAQKLIGTAALEKMVYFLANLMKLYPEAADKADFDEMIDEYAEMVGAGPKTIREAKEVAGIRAQRQQAAQAQNALAMAQAGAKTAQTLGTTPMNPDTALGAMLGRQFGMPQQ